MCGIAGFINLRGQAISGIERKLSAMGELIRHRGPDGEGIWVHPNGHVGFAHRRLAIIDLAETGAQPMSDEVSNWLTYNGEIYNYIELRQELGKKNFRGTSDTEVILHAYRKWGEDCVNKFRGMFSFALWDEENSTLFCARDRFGVKPFYYTQVADVLYFASEVKALLPFLPEIQTDPSGLKDYLTFQFCLSGKTMFKGISELEASHTLTVSNGVIRTRRYWEVFFEPDYDHTFNYFESRLNESIKESVDLHCRSDVPIGAYISGGIDSSLVGMLAANRENFCGFTGKFSDGPEYDESAYARQVAESGKFELYERNITSADFLKNIEKVIYHLDYPVAGPGSFSQYMVSEMASGHRKVVLGGQGGDEIFGGYARYLIAYFEQCIKAAVNGNLRNGNFVVTYESIIPNLSMLKGYVPLLQEFWRDGLFEEMDKRYFRLVNKAPLLGNEVRWDLLEGYSSFDSFKKIFHKSNVKKESYFDLMTHFDFKTLLPALLHVEDRVSMAHGLESRVPLLDQEIVQIAATMPADAKFKNGDTKHVLKTVARKHIPESIVDRKDKMGFPTPFNEWAKGPAQSFIREIFSSKKAKTREYVDNSAIVLKLEKEGKFGRTTWGLLSLELWHQAFHDQEKKFKDMIKE